MEHANRFGGLIRQARQAKDIGSAKLAAAVAVTPSHYSQIETGKRTPSFELAAAIAAELDIGYYETLRAYAGDQADRSRHMPSGKLWESLAKSQPYTLPADAAEGVDNAPDGAATGAADKESE